MARATLKKLGSDKKAEIYYLFEPMVSHREKQAFYRRQNKTSGGASGVGKFPRLDQ